MYIDSITARNFLSIGNELVTISLKDRGLVLVTGQNRDSSAQDDNGAGKSALVRDLPLYGLFGTCARGITPGKTKGWSGDQVINNRTKKNLFVETIVVTDDGTPYHIHRYRAHKKFGNLVQLFRGDVEVTGHDAKSTQDTIDSILGLDYETALNTLVFGQDLMRFFAAATDKDQKEIFEWIVEFSCWTNAQQQASEQATILKQSLTVLEGTVKVKQERLIMLNTELVEYQKKQVEYEQERTVEILNVNRARDESRAALNAIAVKQSRKRKIQETFSSRLSVEKKECAVLLSSTQTEVDAARKKRDGLAVTIGACNKEIKRLSTEVDKFENQEPGSTCPTCGQVIVEGGSDACIRTLRNELERTREKVAPANRELPDIDAQIFELMKQIQEVQQRKQDLAEETGKLSSIETELRSLEQERERTVSALTVHEERIQKLETSKSPYEELCSKRRDEIEKIITSLSEMQEDLDSRREIYTYVDWWKTGFGNSGIKSLLLRSLTPILNAKANEYAQALMDGEISIQFQTQTQLKSGEWRDKFQINAVNSQGSDVYLGNSGGERRRVDVCIALALCHLLRCRRSKQMRLFVADELFENLDETGIERMIRLMHSLADEVGTLLVISHQSGLQDRFSKCWAVVKENGFSRLEIN